MNSVKKNATPTNEFLQFEFGDHEVFVEMRAGEPVFLALDVCNALGIANPHDAIANLPEKQKLTSVVARSGQARNMNFLNEAGLYKLIFRSRKIEAEIFQDWIAENVLPSIRKYGIYCAKFEAVNGFEEDGKTWLKYSEVLNTFEYSHSGSRYAITERYPDEFLWHRDNWWVSEQYARGMAISKSLSKYRKQFKRVPKLNGRQLPELPFEDADKKEGGAA